MRASPGVGDLSGRRHSRRIYETSRRLPGVRPDRRVDDLEAALVERRHARHAVVEALVALEIAEAHGSATGALRDDYARKVAELEKIEKRIRHMTLL